MGADLQRFFTQQCDWLNRGLHREFADGFGFPLPVQHGKDLEVHASLSAFLGWLRSKDSWLVLEEGQYFRYVVTSADPPREGRFRAYVTVSVMGPNEQRLGLAKATYFMRQLDEGFVIEMVTCPGVQMTVSAQMAEPRTRSC
jgi:hypothetical protein